MKNRYRHALTVRWENQVDFLVRSARSLPESLLPQLGGPSSSPCTRSCYIYSESMARPTVIGSMRPS